MRNVQECPLVPKFFIDYLTLGSPFKSAELLGYEKKPDSRPLSKMFIIYMLFVEHIMYEYIVRVNR